MKIHGKEVGFALNMGASAEIAKLCPGGDLRRVNELLGDANYGENVETIAKFVEILCRWNAVAKKWEGESADTLCLEEILSLSPTEFAAAQAEAMSAFAADSEGEIETVDDSKNADREGL